MSARTRHQDREKESDQADSDPKFSLFPDLEADLALRRVEAVAYFDALEAETAQLETLEDFIDYLLPRVEKYIKYDEKHRRKTREELNQDRVDYITRCWRAGLNVEQIIWLLDAVVAYAPMYLGTSASKVAFINWCNEQGLGAFEIKEASWILHDHMRPKARAREKELAIGLTAEQAFGHFDPNATGDEGRFVPTIPARELEVIDDTFEENAVVDTGSDTRTAAKKIRVVVFQSGVAACKPDPPKRKAQPHGRHEQSIGIPASQKNKRKSKTCYPFKSKIRAAKNTPREKVEVGDRIPAPSRIRKD